MTTGQPRWSDRTDFSCSGRFSASASNNTFECHSNTCCKQARAQLHWPNPGPMTTMSAALHSSARSSRSSTVLTISAGHRANAAGIASPPCCESDLSRTHPQCRFGPPEWPPRQIRYSRQPPAHDRPGLYENCFSDATCCVRCSRVRSGMPRWAPHPNTCLGYRDQTAAHHPDSLLPQQYGKPLLITNK